MFKVTNLSMQRWSIYTVSKKLEASSNIPELIILNCCEERFRSLVRDTSLPLWITLVYLKTTTAYVRSKLLAQRQWANTRATVTYQVMKCIFKL